MMSFMKGMAVGIVAGDCGTDAQAEKIRYAFEKQRARPLETSVTWWIILSRFLTEKGIN